MAISLSDLTGASTSGNVLNEVNSYADFLDSVPRLVNKADPTGNTDAVQTVATKQPIALPLIDGEGYLFLSGVTGNYARFNEAILPNNTDFDISIDFYYGGPVAADYDPLFSQYNTTDPNRFFIFIRNNRTLGIFWAGFSYSTLVVENGRHTVRFVKSGSTITVYLDGVQGNSLTHSTDIAQTQTRIGDNPGLAQAFKGAIFSVTEANGLFDVDFTSPRIPHGASEFLSDSNHQIVVNTSGNNPAKVIKKSVLRYDGVDDFMEGVLGQTVTGGYMFAAFSVNGSGGDDSGRFFGINSTGANDNDLGGVFYGRYGSGANFASRYNGTATYEIHDGLLNSDLKDIIFESKFTNGSQTSKINNADEDNGANTTIADDLSAEEFAIASYTNGDYNTSIDLEYLALFDATLTDAQADQVRNFINNRNKVFSLIDSQGYYFFDGAATSDGQVFTGSGSWNGRIVGSDNGDSDKYISQNTLDDRPTTDGYKITFADNTDHFDIPSTSQAGWQIVGTSLGTFAYKVNDDAVTELTMLGNAGTYRAFGDLYGIMLLPESATNRDIEEARKLLIDRGALDAAYTGGFGSAWLNRTDIVEFRQTAFQGTTTLYRGWKGNSNLASFSSMQATNCYNFTEAWNGCSSLTQFPQDAKLGTEATNVNFNQAWESSGLTSFPALDLSNGNSFVNAWKFCSDLQSFSSNAKLGTEASNVNFQSAWSRSGLQNFSGLDLSTGTYFPYAWYVCSSLTSFDVDLPSATSVYYAWADCTSLSSFTTTDIKNCSNFQSAWQSCSSLQSFPEDALLGTEATNVNFESAWRSSGLQSFNTPLPTAGNLYLAWYNCQSLTSFDSSLSSTSNVRQAWQSCISLTDFSAGVFDNWNPSSINSGVFNATWDGCSSLTTQSVENILVPIANSGKWATNNGLEGGTALTDATIDIDYDVSTGSLTAATLTAIETLNGRGWSVNINNEIIVPNILQLQPAAAYSLRSFDSDADPTVVNVRRSSDGSLSDFTASQVSDGTLTSWVNNVVTISPTLNNGGFEDGATGWTLGSATTIDSTVSHSGSNSAKLNVVGGAYTFLQRAVSPLEVGKEVTVGFWAKTSDASKALNVSLGVSTHLINFTTTDWEYKEITRVIFTNTTMIFARSGTGDFTIHIDDITVTNLTADGYVTTFYDQSTNGNDSTQSTASSQPLIVQNGVLVTENGEAALSFDEASDQYIVMSHSDLYGQSRLDSFYVTSTSDSTYLYPARTTSGTYHGLVADDGATFSYISGTNYGTVSAYANNTLFTGTTRDDYHAATVGYKLISHEDAQTVGWDSLNFGRYGTAVSIYSYTGKLQEMIFFNTDQSANRVAIQNNINDHFNIYS